MTWPVPSVAYPFPDRERTGEIEQILSKYASILTEDGTEVEKTYFDTFDWRVYRSQGTLEHANDHWVWRGAEGRLPFGRHSGPPPAFVWDLAEGELREALTAILAMRRLLPRVTVKKGSKVYRILDNEEKTVVRVSVEEGTAKLPQARQPSSLPTVIHVRPVRGYLKDFEKVKLLLEKKLGLLPDHRSDLELAMAAVKHEPGDYTSKFSLYLPKDLEAAEAARRIHRDLLKTMLRNEDGTRKDLDSEFLHDFRVSIRRTRSALTQFKGVFPRQATERFKRDFAWLGSATGPVRDLDVWLLKLDGYRATLPAGVGKMLDALESFLKTEQATEHDRLVGVLDSGRFGGLVNDWRHFLAQATRKAKPPVNARRPVRTVAAERIVKVWRRVMKKGGRIKRKTPREALHELRIECKKLRYLLEFFRSLFDADHVGALVKELKHLQDNLGDFNDYEVQQDTLRKFAERMSASGAAPAATLMAMGRLVSTLEEGQAKERERFEECFERFSRPANADRFEKLFSARAS